MTSKVIKPFTINPGCYLPNSVVVDSYPSKIDLTRFIKDVSFAIANIEQRLDIIEERLNDK